MSRRAQVVAAALTTLLPTAATAQAVQPGAWDVTSTIVELSVPGVPGFIQRMVRGRSKAEHKRLAAGESVAALLAPDPKAHCRVESQTIDGGRYAPNRRLPTEEGRPAAYRAHRHL